MEYSEILIRLKNALDSYFPPGHSYVKKLSGLLHVHPRSINYKLSGVTEFRLEEILVIADLVGKPVGFFLERDVERDRHPMEILLVDYGYRGEQYGVLWNFEVMAKAAASHDSRFMVACNSIPYVGIAGFKWLTRFFQLKSLYFISGLSPVASLDEVEEQVEVLGPVREWMDYRKGIKRSVYVVNVNLLGNFLNEIQFFLSLRLLSRSDLLCLLDDVERLYKLMERVTASGQLNGKEIELLYCDTMIYQDMCIVESEDVNVAFLCGHGQHSIVAKDGVTLDLIRKWFSVYLHSSSLVSFCAEQNRSFFLDIQRRAIDDFRTGNGL